MDWKEEYKKKLCTADEAVKIVNSGDTVHIGTCSSLAYVLANSLYKRKNELYDVVISSATNLWLLPFYYDEPNEHFSILTYFAGPAEREAMRHRNCKATSLHLSQVDKWCEDFCKDQVAFIEVSAPDEHGNMSYGAYGVSMHDLVRQNCSRIVLQVNKQVPYVYGINNVIHISQADYVIETDTKIATIDDLPYDDKLKTISATIADQIKDGSCIQLGLGGLSGAIGFALENKNDLGVHSEMLTNSMMYLMKQGVITNKKKNYMNGKAVVAFALGSKELYDFTDHNSNLLFAPYTFVNDPNRIGRNDNMISVNTAMSIDLFGQVASDSMAGKQQSAVGGQVDYVRGAQLSKGGKSFIALPSVHENNHGINSRIVASFEPGTAVTTSRQDVQYIVTEYGCVNLKPLSIADRARALIELAHPDYREKLKDQAKQLKIL